MFGWDFKVNAKSRHRSWSLIKICDEPVIWTQPSGPLCLWQCFLRKMWNGPTDLDTKTIHLPFTYFYLRPNVMSYKFGVPRDPPWWVVTALRACCVSNNNSSDWDKVVYLCQIFFGASRQLVCKSDKVPFADVPSSFYIGWRRQRREVWGQSQPLQEQLSSVCLVKTSSIIIVLIFAYLRLLCR